MWSSSFSDLEDQYFVSVRRTRGSRCYKQGFSSAYVCRRVGTSGSLWMRDAGGRHVSVLVRTSVKDRNRRRFLRRANSHMAFEARRRTFVEQIILSTMAA